MDTYRVDLPTLLTDISNSVDGHLLQCRWTLPGFHLENCPRGYVKLSKGVCETVGIKILRGGVGMMVKDVTNFTNFIWTVGVCSVCGGFHTGFCVLGRGKLQCLVLTWSMCIAHIN